MLTSGKSKSCGCAKLLSHGDKTSLIGKKFNKLQVVAFDHFDENKKDYWKCKCDCGNETVVQGYNLKSGAVKSCGCGYQLCQFEDITGNKYNMITVVKFLYRKNLQSYFLCRCDCGNEFIANANNLKRNHYYSCGCTNRSCEESCVYDYISSIYNGEILQNKRIISVDDDTKHNKEIDIYVPKLNLGIEYNGSIYHASLNGLYSNKSKYYHRDKFLQAKKQGIHLINIFDVDWEINQSKIKMYLKSLFILNIKIYARTCRLQKITSNVAHDFCSKYHLQGQARIDSICYGLYYDNELIEVMTFGKLRLKKQQEGYYELHRLCTKDNLIVVGGANRLLKAFEREYKPEWLLSYSNNDYFTGNIYTRLGFNYIKQVSPPYYWFYKNREYKREKCQVKRLRILYPDLVKEAEDKKIGIEDYVMINLGARKVYRSGNTRWEKRYK